jgi:hypothetical protein
MAGENILFIFRYENFHFILLFPPAKHKKKLRDEFNDEVKNPK